MPKVICLFLLSIITVLCVVGCSAVVRTADYFDQCMSDPVCRDEVYTVRTSATEAATVAATVAPSGTPYSAIIGGVVGSLVSYVYGVIQGRKKAGV